ncbi:MAG: hypothetical protein EP317_05690 [Bacillota bacterium]|nr:MAG: hypothetical protein EP317_05690 [Bacillota bacterium]
MSLKLITWTPRVLSILLVLILFMLSFDVFEEDDIWYMLMLGFLIHNIPVMILITTIIISWKRPLFGSFIFLPLGVFYAVYMLIKNGSSFLLAVISLGLPAIIIGLFYMWDDHNRRKSA